MKCPSYHDGNPFLFLAPTWRSGRDVWGTKIGRAIAWWWRNGWPGKTRAAVVESVWRYERRTGMRFPLWMRRHPGSGGTRWDFPYAPPRTCSYCGSVHPDDLSGLMTRGWSVQRTDKNYKAYIQPPQGYGPVPPVKLYGGHEP